MFSRDLGGIGQSAGRRIALLSIVSLLMIGLLALVVARPYFERQLLKETTGRAELFQTTLDQTLQRFQHLPLVLSEDPLIVGAFFGIGAADMNRRLEAIADRAGIEAVYLLNPDGLTIAASNYATAQTFLGQNYGFRPYFQEAMSGRHGTFFAIGATTLRPGYFIADGVRSVAGDVIGVVVVKIDLAALMRTWAGTGETVFVSNADDVIILASDPTLRYQTLAEIDALRRDEITAERQFGDEPLNALDWRAEDRSRALLNGDVFQHVWIPLDDAGWTLHFLGPLDAVTERTWLVAIGSMVVVAALAVLALAIRSQRMQAALVLAEDHRSALMAANEELRRTQAELERNSKLAALGHLAASVTHELGQPISALRNYLTAAEIKDEGNPLVQPMGRIVGRMEGIARELRFFARWSTEPMRPVDLSGVVDDALALVRHDAAGACVRVAWERPGEPAFVLGNALRLEQVVVNLFRNAISAMDGRPARTLTVAIVVGAESVDLSVSDTGSGTGGRTLDQISEPFASTRRSGDGMGLGLAISAEIVREHKGGFALCANEEGGAVFTVSLPPATEDARAGS
ncbi:MAG: ATP-binding protein [Pseudomonadota bacterium]